MPAADISLPQPPPLWALTEGIVDGGRRPVAVGGAIRVAALGLPAKEVDVEVFGEGRAAPEEAFAGFCG